MELAHVSPSPRILRLPSVIARTGLSRSTIYEHISNGNFPEQISLSAHSVGWIENEVDSWIATRIAASRSARD